MIREKILSVKSHETHQHPYIGIQVTTYILYTCFIYILSFLDSGAVFVITWQVCNDSELKKLKDKVTDFFSANCVYSPCWAFYHSDSAVHLSSSFYARVF